MLVSASLVWLMTPALAVVSIIWVLWGWSASHGGTSIAAMLFGTTADGEGGLVATVAPIDFAGGTVVHYTSPDTFHGQVERALGRLATSQIS